MKLFFKRAPEMQHMLGRLLKTCLEDTSCAAVHDRALLYYRLLRQNLDDAAAIVGAGETTPIASFLEEMNDKVKDQVFAEFNTLSCVYGEPAETFISEDYKFAAPPVEAFDFSGSAKPEAEPAAAAGAGAGAGAATGAGAGGGAAAAGGDGGMDLLGFDMFGAAPAPAAPAAPALSLLGGATIAPQEYQSKWLALSATYVLRRAPAVWWTVMSLLLWLRLC